MKKLLTVVLLCFAFVAAAKEKKPLILISSYYEDDKEQVHVGQSYYKAVERAGGIPLIMPITDNEEIIESYVDLADGVIIIGGNDVTPSLYGAKEHPKLEKTVKVQDDSDMLLIKALKDSKVPVLAICRGAQLTNVAFGGTLYQDLPSELKKSKVNHRQSQHKSKATHSVKIKEGSEFSKILSGATQVDVNTFHHQAANKVGKGLIVVAESEDGVIEGLESRNGQWICPQFHPEGLAEDKNSIMIRFFEHLIERAK